VTFRHLRIGKQPSFASGMMEFFSQNPFSNKKKSVSNLSFARILPDRASYRKGKLEKVSDKMEL
jgi:hypothetical protein